MKRITSTADGSGEYILTALPAGYYSITVTAAGFKTAVVNGLKLDAGSRLRQDLKMEIGQTSQTVQVVAETPALATDTATLSAEITPSAWKICP